MNIFDKVLFIFLFFFCKILFLNLHKSCPSRILWRFFDPLKAKKMSNVRALLRSKLNQQCTLRADLHWPIASLILYLTVTTVMRSESYQYKQFGICMKLLERHLLRSLHSPFASSTFIHLFIQIRRHYSY